MHDYWPSCGYNLLGQDAERQLVVTDDFLRSLMERPELAPVAQSCVDELSLHRQLLDQPRAAVDPAQLARVRDEDARANYSIWLRFRQRLLAQPTLEASYLALFRGEGVDVPPVFVHRPPRCCCGTHWAARRPPCRRGPPRCCFAPSASQCRTTAG